MPRPLLSLPAGSFVQGSLLLKPSPELTDIILGVIGKAQDLCKMTILAFVVVGTHERLLLSRSNAEELSWQSIRDGLPKAAR